MSAALRLRVVPNAKRNEVVGVHGDAIKIKIHAPALDGKANAALVEFIAEKLGIPARNVALQAGEKSRDKTIAIAGMEATEARRRLLGESQPGYAMISLTTVPATSVSRKSRPA